MNAVEFIELLAKYPVMFTVFCAFVLLILGLLFYVIRAISYAIRGFFASSNTGTLKVGNLLEWSAKKQKKGIVEEDIEEEQATMETLSINMLNRIETCIRSSIQETARFFNQETVDIEDVFNEQSRNAEKILDDTRRSVNSRYSDAVYKEIQNRIEATASSNYFEKVSAFHFAEIMSGLSTAFRTNHLGERNDEAFQEYVVRTANQLTGNFIYNLSAHEKPIYTHIIQALRPEFERLLSTAIRGILASARESSVDHKHKVNNWRALLGVTLNNELKRNIPNMPPIDIDSITELKM